MMEAVPLSMKSQNTSLSKWDAPCCAFQSRMSNRWLPAGAMPRPRAGRSSAERIRLSVYMEGGGEAVKGGSVPQLFGWMVQVHPFNDAPEQIRTYEYLLFLAISAGR